ncbi:MAG: hypothetical protein COA32_01465 [Fluviicola sp.]|nr:MAG: hypothetical protein COA32_01465 [Fluviicola sp.]
MEDKNTYEPLVSVLIPCYNAMPYLTEALDSIVNQTYKNLEILCINDGSTDQTGEVLKQYAQEDGRIKVIHNESNLKLITTLNNGVQSAKGEFIARMDADDISYLDRIENQMKIFKNHPHLELVSSIMEVMNEEGRSLGFDFHRQSTTKSCYFASFFYVPFDHAPMIVRKNVLIKHPFLNEKHVLHTEDYELFARLLRNNVQIYNHPFPLYKVRINSKSVSRKFEAIQDENFIKCSLEHFSIENGSLPDINEFCVFVNRIPADISVLNVFKGLRLMSSFKRKFLATQNLNQIEKKEVILVYYSHLFDVLYQGLKRAQLKSKRVFLYFFIKNSYNFIFRNKVRRYILNKTKLK